MSIEYTLSKSLGVLSIIVRYIFVLITKFTEAIDVKNLVKIETVVWEIKIVERNPVGTCRL